MRERKKILILLPDGVGLRNFAFTSFVEIGKSLGWDIIFWNHTPFDLGSLGYKELKLDGKVRAKTDLLKKAKIAAELDHFTRKFNDPVYQTYKFENTKSSVKKRLKNGIVTTMKNTHRGKKGLKAIRDKMKTSERKGVYYQNCLKQLKQEKPDIVFCTNQRPVNAIAPLTAASDLKIPTACFIFSWDNLPKATMVVDTDHYFVWSDFMKKELLSYYPYIEEDQVHVTGSPQFEPHYNSKLLKKRAEFFEEYGLDENKKYICFSGDDSTTCPDDPQYLNDLAESIEKLNSKGMNLGIIFRKCPTDFSDRYYRVLKKFPNLISSIAPKWKKVGDSWNAVLPTIEDLQLQINTIAHSEAVVNLASSMVFDFAVLGKPCLYLNYDVPNKVDLGWSPGKVYNFVHFRSMPTGNEVYWLNSKDQLEKKILDMLNDSSKTVEKALEWFDLINMHPADKASERLWAEIEKL